MHVSLDLKPMKHEGFQTPPQSMGSYNFKTLKMKELWVFPKIVVPPNHPF